jgi:hypothetical protein
MIIEAILKINPSAIVNVRGTDLDTCEIIWLEDTTPISKSNIEAKMTELQTAYDNNAYQRTRAKAYPSLQEFAEAYCEKEIGGTSTKWDAYKTAYNKVRTDNPKPD